MDVFVRKELEDMNLKMDSIQFESRREIESIMTCLLEYINRHEREDSTTLDNAIILYDKLNTMHMGW